MSPTFLFWNDDFGLSSEGGWVLRFHSCYEFETGDATLHAFTDHFSDDASIAIEIATRDRIKLISNPFLARWKIQSIGHIDQLPTVKHFSNRGLPNRCNRGFTGIDNGHPTYYSTAQNSDFSSFNRNMRYDAMSSCNDM